MQTKGLWFRDISQDFNPFIAFAKIKMNYKIEGKGYISNESPAQYLSQICKQFNRYICSGNMKSTHRDIHYNLLYYVL